MSLGSIAALQGFYGQANYAAAKAGVQAMMRVISREGAPNHGTTTSCSADPSSTALRMVPRATPSFVVA
ncbi:MAG: SDR family NAD(P)-dependent oxidoreductase [Opitutaceae bacterium]